jgi:hypothetical protein
MVLPIIKEKNTAPKKENILIHCKRVASICTSGAHPPSEVGPKGRKGAWHSPVGYPPVLENCRFTKITWSMISPQ